MSILQKLTEGVQSRDMRAEGAALLNKWEATGLLEGLNSESQKQGMACLLENQAKELLREASSMGAGDVEGFAAVAFPIVRRVFGGLIANDLVSVQPMSLPSGLIFFLDFVKSPDKRAGLATAPESIYGGNKVGKEIQTGVDLNPAHSDAGRDPLDAGGFYDFNTGFSHATGSVINSTKALAVNATVVAADRVALVADTPATLTSQKTIADFKANTAAGAALAKLVDFDPDFLAITPTTTRVVLLDLPIPSDLNRDALSTVRLERAADKRIAVSQNADNAEATDQLVLGCRQIRRLTKLVDTTGNGTADKLRVCIINNDADVAVTDENSSVAAHIIAAADHQVEIQSYAKADQLDAVSGGLGALNVLGVDGSSHELENANDMAEIDIKVDSIAVTAQTKKLKAKWSPELGQDLNAYHNLDAEVELTGILSEQIALEIDRELLGELVNGATAGTRYWSRAPGLFVDSSGTELGATSASPDFTGTVSEWYETLIETINDVSAQIHRKTLRGGANFVVCSPEVANILEFTSGFRASVTADTDRGTIGAVKSGSLSKKFDVYVDPYFLRNVILIGRKGSSFLESGFVYAPYVPLQVTPTIFGTEDFVPRKGVMTRYAKKMVRPDMYGLVVVRGLLGESGATA